MGTNESKDAYRRCVFAVSGRIGGRLWEIKARLEQDRRSPGALAKLRSSADVGPEIFISYAREDQERIADLAAALGRKGWSVSRDRDIPPGGTSRSHIDTRSKELGA
jgi:hypothetical protein